MSDGMGREPAYLSSHATNRYFIPNWGKYIHEDYDHDGEDCDLDDFDQGGYDHDSYDHDDYGEHDLDGWYGDEY